MFLMNCWYCAGWDFQVTQGKDSIVARTVAGKRITQTVPCNWILHFRAFTAGNTIEGESDGQFMLDSWSCQAITPRDEKSVDYYYSWGVSKKTDQPSLSDLLKEGLDRACAEDSIQIGHFRTDDSRRF